MKITYISNKNSWKAFLVWILCLLFSNIYAAIPAGTTIIFDNSNTNWDAVYIAITSTNNSSKGVDSYEPKYDTWLGKMKSSDGESYIFTTTEEYSGNNISFYNKDISNYDNLWEVEVAISKQYTSPNNTFKAQSFGCLSPFSYFYVDVIKQEEVKEETEKDDDLPEIYPHKFFTPNGDGVNEYWEVDNIEYYPDSEIEIYDRFSKLLVRYKGTERGWDGIYNGHPMQTDDYWYLIKLFKVKEWRSGHFTLKR